MFFAGAVACKIVNALPVFCILISIYTLVLMSWERYRAIVKAHIPRLSTKNIRNYLIAVWAASIVCTVPTMVEYSIYTLNDTSKITVPAAQIFLADDDPYNCNSIGCCVSDEIFTTVRSNVVNNHTTLNNPYFILWSPSSHEQLRFTSEQIAGLRNYFSAKLPQCNTTHQYFVNVTTFRNIIRCGSSKMHSVYSLISGLFLLLVAYVLPSIAIWVNYGRVIHFILDYTKRTSAEQPSNYHANFVLFKHKVKILKMLVIVAALFELCWIQYFSILMYAVSINM